MSQIQPSETNLKELASILEPLIRRVVREELRRFLKKEADTFQLDPNMLLYKDMEDIKHRKDQNQIELYSHSEVWSE